MLLPEVKISTEKSKKVHLPKNYRIAGIYHESFNFVNFVNFKAFAKIKAST